jgi:hypothetical protein
MEPGEHKHCYQDEYYPQQWRSQEVHRFSKRRIAASLGISATAAMECVQRARRAGLEWPRLLISSNAAQKNCLP